MGFLDTYEYRVSSIIQDADTFFKNDEEYSYLSLDFASLHLMITNKYAIDTLFLQSIRISVTIGNLGVLTKITAVNAFNANLTYRYSWIPHNAGFGFLDLAPCQYFIPIGSVTTFRSALCLICPPGYLV
jgi:hypothetical protein